MASIEDYRPKTILKFQPCNSFDYRVPYRPQLIILFLFFFLFQAASRDREQTEIFRLGVQKCKKIIYDCVPPKPEIFQGEGIDVLFKMLSALYEGRELSDIDKETMTLPAK